MKDSLLCSFFSSSSFFYLLCVVIFKSVLKSIFSIISAAGFRQNKRTHKHGSTVRVKITDCFNVFRKILLQSIFVARIINKNKNKSKNSKMSGTNSEATSGHSGASLKHS